MKPVFPDYPFLVTMFRVMDRRQILLLTQVGIFRLKVSNTSTRTRWENRS